MIFKALNNSTIRGLGEMLRHRYASRTFASATEDMQNLTVMENGDKVSNGKHNSRFRVKIHGAYVCEVRYMVRMFAS